MMTVYAYIALAPKDNRVNATDPHAPKDPLKGMKYYPKEHKWGYSRQTLYASREYEYPGNKTWKGW